MLETSLEFAMIKIRQFFIIQSFLSFEGRPLQISVDAFGLILFFVSIWLVETAKTSCLNQSCTRLDVSECSIVATTANYIADGTVMTASICRLAENRMANPFLPFTCQAMGLVTGGAVAIGFATTSYEEETGLGLRIEFKRNGHGFPA